MGCNFGVSPSFIAMVFSHPAAASSRQEQAAAGAAKFQFYSRVSEVTLGPFLGFHCYVFALSDVFRKGCLAVCFLLWRLFDCSSTTAAPQQQQEQPPVAAPAAGSNRQQAASASSMQQQAAAGSSRQQQAAAGSSSSQQQPGAGRSRQQAAGSSRQQQAAGSSRQRQAAAKFQFYSRVSEVTLGPFWGSAFNAAARLRMAAWTVAT